MEGAAARRMFSAGAAAPYMVGRQLAKGKYYHSLWYTVLPFLITVSTRLMVV